MDELAKFQQRILENQRKLEEIDARRKELAEATKKRKLEEEKERIIRQEEEEVRKKRKLMGLAKPRCDISVKGRVASLELIEMKLGNHSVFRAVQGKSLLLCLGFDCGRVDLLDVLNSFSCEVSVEVNAENPVLALKHITSCLSVRRKPPKDKSKKKQITDTSSMSSTASFLVASSGCDLCLISSWNWSKVHTVQDAHENEIYALESLQVDEGVLVFSSALDHFVKGWDACTWTCLFVLKGHADGVLDLKVFPALSGDPSSVRLCTASDDSTIRVWDVVKHCRDARARLEMKQGPSEKPPTTISAEETQGTEAKGEKKGKGKEGKTTEPDEDDDDPLIVTKAEHVLSDHEDFVGNLALVCARDAEDSSKETYFLVSGSGDFSIRVWDHDWKCVRVLETEKFVARLSFVSGNLVAATRSGMDLDECQLFTYQVGSAVPLRWKMKEKSMKILMPNAMLARNIDLESYAAGPLGEGKPKFGTFLVTAPEDESRVQVWSTPFQTNPKVNLAGSESTVQQDEPPPLQVPPPNASLTSSAPQKATTSSTSSSTSAAPSSSQQPEATVASVGEEGVKAMVPAGTVHIPTGQYTGDTIAKRFIHTILDIGNLSPDMTRLLNVCLHLHSSSSS